MKPLLIGEAPGRTGDPSKPLEGRCGERLASCMEISPSLYARLYDRINVFDVPLNGPFPIKRARERARSMFDSLNFSKRPFVLFIGYNPARAFGVGDVFLNLRLWPELGYCAIVPHPSGRNLWWNHPCNRRRASAFLSGLHKKVIA